MRCGVLNSVGFISVLILRAVVAAYWKEALHHEVSEWVIVEINKVYRNKGDGSGGDIFASYAKLLAQVLTTITIFYFGQHFQLSDSSPLLATVPVETCSVYQICNARYSTPSRGTILVREW